MGKRLALVALDQDRQNLKLDRFRRVRGRIHQLIDARHGNLMVLGCLDVRDHR
jgi:hypothetical protein